MKAEVCRADPSREFLTAEKCFILEVANDAGDPEVSIAWARVPASVTTKWHRVRGIVERYVIVSGTGRVEVGNLPRQRRLPRAHERERAEAVRHHQDETFSSLDSRSQLRASLRAQRRDTGGSAAVGDRPYTSSVGPGRVTASNPASGTKNASSLS